MKKNISVLLLSLLLVPNLALVSCTGIPPEQKNCTLIGCVDGLKVDLTGTLPEEFKVVVKGSDGAILAERTCNASSQCGNSIFFSDIKAGSVTVEYSTGENTKSETFNDIGYKESRPNGPDCPPVCSQGSVTMNITH